MKQRVINFFIAILILFTQVKAFGQNKDSLIILHPIIGKKADIYENFTYSLFPDIKGFQSATFYIRNNKYLISRVKFVSDDGRLRDTIISEPLFVLQNKRAKIRLIYNNKKDKISRERTVAIFTKDGSIIKGNIARITGQSIVLFVPSHSQLSDYSKRDFVRIPRQEIEKVLIQGESNILAGIGWGGLIGFGSGALIGLLLGDDNSGWIRFSAGQKAMMFGTTFGLIGGIAGLFYGAISSSSDEIIVLKTARDYDLLKEKFPYAF